MLNVSYSRYTAISCCICILLVIMLASCDDIFEEDLSDDIVTHITPGNQDTSTIQSQQFKWEAVHGALQYRIQIVSPSFTAINSYTLDTTISSTQIYHTLSPGIYQWRVKALNYFSESEFSVPYTIVIDTTSDLSNQLVVLTTPVSNADLNDTLPTFNWQNMGIANSYNIILKSGTNWTTGAVIFDDTITVNSYTSTINLSEGQYLWGVRAINTFSYTSSFNQQVLNIDLTNPPKPVPVSPSNSSSQTTGTINFTWTRPADLGSYNSSRFDSLFVFTDTLMTILHGKYYTTNTSYALSLTQSDTYFWYLIGYDNAGNKSDTSSVYSFTIP